MSPIDFILTWALRLLVAANAFCLAVGLVAGGAILAGILFDLPFCSPGSTRPWIECLASDLSWGLLFLFPLLLLVPAVVLILFVRKMYRRQIGL